MFSVLISRLIILATGTLYPAYRSYKAVRAKDMKEYGRWMVYWIAYALFTSVESVSDIFLFWFPFYYELKVVFVLWMLSPWGASTIYRKWIQPFFQQREKEIDNLLNKAKSEAYQQALTLGHRGLTYATGFVSNATSHLQLSHTQLFRQVHRSFSMDDMRRNDVSINDLKLNDLSFDRTSTIQISEIQEADEIQEEYEEVNRDFVWQDSILTNQVQHANLEEEIRKEHENIERQFIQPDPVLLDQDHLSHNDSINVIGDGEISNIESTSVDPPRKKRGRPPKNASELTSEVTFSKRKKKNDRHEVQDDEINNAPSISADPQKKKRGRPTRNVTQPKTYAEANVTKKRKKNNTTES